jgi:hypothetical protein
VQLGGLLGADVDLLDLVLAALDNLKEGDKGAALVVREVNREGVRYPAVDTTTTRVDPEKVLEAKGFWKESADGLRRRTYPSTPCRGP